MSYIEREAVLLHLNDIWLSATPTDTMYDDDRQLAMVRCMGLNDAMDVVKEEPAADVRPVVRGKWNRTDAYPHRLYCSVCYKTYLKNDELLERWEFPLNFCPNCGAMMEES